MPSIQVFEIRLHGGKHFTHDSFSNGTYVTCLNQYRTQFVNWCYVVLYQHSSATAQQLRDIASAQHSNAEHLYVGLKSKRHTVLRCFHSYRS